MKKILLFAIVASMATSSVNAQEPKVYTNEAFSGMSPNGNYAVSVMYDYVAIYNLITGEKDEYPEGYRAGNGNAISNTGVVVGSSSFEKACYWKGGQWYEIESTAEYNMSYANGITPEGTRIVGSVSPESYAGDYEGLMLTPCYWDVKADGTLSEFHRLPYPDKDLTGRTPQYITAIRISNDGKTIAGQMLDYTGYVCQPVIYQQDENGDWSYTLIHDELFHPENIVLPEYPGDDGPTTDPYAFMTPEEQAAYDQALEDWNATGEWDYSTYPNQTDYMGEESMAAYEAALAVYEEWDEKFNAYMEAYNELCEAVPTFSFNNVLMSSDGKTYATTHTYDAMDWTTWETISEYTPYVFSLENDTYKTYPNDDVNLILTSITDNGTLLAQKQASMEEPFATAYILPAGAEKFETLYDYFTTANASLAEWIKENMTHEYEAYDMDTWEPYMAEAVATGVPFTNPDMSIITTYVENFWYDWGSFDWENDNPDDVPGYYSYVFHPDFTTGLASISNGKDAASVSGQKGGMLLFKGEVANATVYNLNGAKVYTVEAPEAMVATGLGTGVYVVKVVATNGTVTFAKVAL